MKSLIDILELSEQEPTQVVNHDRRNMVDVKSIAI